MSFHLSYSPYPEDNIPYVFLGWWVKALPVVIHLLTAVRYRRPVYNSHLSGNLLVYPPKDLLKEYILNGRKPKGSTTGNGDKPSQSPPLEWINAPLTAEDYIALERDASGLEYLSGLLIGLVCRGYGVSVKYDSERRRYNCTIYRPPSDSNRRHMGLSGFAPDVRDAILVTLYRFELKCRGELTDDLVSDSRNKPERRFG
jgi:hypothetical protein